MADFIVGGAVICLIAFVVRVMIKDKKNGGCAGCSGSCGSCGHCSPEKR